MVNGRLVSESWTTYFNTITSTAPPPIRDDLIDSNGMATERWVEHFRDLSVTSSASPPPIENKLAPDGFIAQPWVEWFLDVTG